MSARVERETDTQASVQRPRMYTVVMHNDDYTTMDFVVMVLMRVFRKERAEAERVMMEIHQSGKSAAGSYVFDIALSKKMLAERMAAESDFPLRLTVEMA